MPIALPVESVMFRKVNLKDWPLTEISGLFNPKTSKKRN